MRTTNANFDAKHELDYKTPMYLVHFDGETTDYCNHKPGSPTNTLKQYLVSIDGVTQSVKPEEGKSSIGSLKIIIQDYNDEITALIASDAYYFDRKKVTVKAGYLGMDEADMLEVPGGWITDIQMSDDLLGYVVTVTDPQKWMLRKIFRGAEDSTVTLTGHSLNIALAVLTSTGAGTNGAHDWLAAANGLGIDDDFINVSNIENIRDTWFPGSSWNMSFTITKREQAKSWLSREIFKFLSLYPVVNGSGQFDLVVVKPPLAAIESTQALNEDVIIGNPKWDENLGAKINEIEFHYNWNSTTEKYVDQTDYIDGTSVDNRGPGDKPLVLKTRGLTNSALFERIKRRVFNRYSNPPPIKISITAFFSKWLHEVGDVVSVSHDSLPDLEAGTRGIDGVLMEVISRNIDWQKGRVKMTLLDTGFSKDTYGAISPTMTVVSGTSATQFTVSTADAAKFAEGWEASVHDSKMRVISASVTILTINTATGVITCDSIGQTPQAGWKVQFADYSNCMPQQQKYAFCKSAAPQQIITP